MKAVLVNHNYEPTWLKEYDFDVTIYDRSDDGIVRDLQQYGKVYKTRNIGDVDFDKLSYLVENYDTLPDIFLWGKTNLLKYVDKETLDAALEKGVYTPLLRKDHRTYSDKWGQVNFYREDIYWERADSWFFNAGGVDSRHFHNWNQWCGAFAIPNTAYIPFPPGGNFLLTRQQVQKYSRDLYQSMLETMPYSTRPVEAQCAERSYYFLWK